MFIKQGGSSLYNRRVWPSLDRVGNTGTVEFLEVHLIGKGWLWTQGKEAGGREEVDKLQ